MNNVTLIDKSIIDINTKSNVAEEEIVNKFY